MSSSLTDDKDKLNEKLYNALCGSKSYSVEALLLAGADLNSLNQRDNCWFYSSVHRKKNTTKKLISLLVSHGLTLSQINAQTKYGHCAMSLLIQTGKWDLAHQLMELGANTHVVSENGESLLHLMCYGTHKGLKETEIEKVKGIFDKVITDPRVHIDHKARRDFTPLHKACETGNLWICEWLIAKGADVNARTINGNTPLHKAVEGPHPDIIQCLLSHGAKSEMLNVFGTTPLQRREHWKAPPINSVSETKAILKTAEESLVLTDFLESFQPSRAQKITKTKRKNML